MEKEWESRTALSIWLYTNRHVNKLKRFGSIHYVSSKMNYVVLYVDLKSKDEIIEKISQFHFVRKIDASNRPDMSMDFQKSLEEYGQSIEEMDKNPLLS